LWILTGSRNEFSYAVLMRMILGLLHVDRYLCGSLDRLKYLLLFLEVFPICALCRRSAITSLHTIWGAYQIFGRQETLDDPVVAVQLWLELARIENFTLLSVGVRSEFHGLCFWPLHSIKSPSLQPFMLNFRLGFLLNKFHWRFRDNFVVNSVHLLLWFLFPVLQAVLVRQSRWLGVVNTELSLVVNLDKILLFSGAQALSILTLSYKGFIWTYKPCHIVLKEGVVSCHR
jgi:hypothetical protein